MTSGNFLANIIDNSHPDLSKRKLNTLVSIGIDYDEKKVYVYSFPSQRIGLKEVKCQLTFDEAKKYLKRKNATVRGYIAFEVKEAYLKAIAKDKSEENETKRILYGR
jgi:hypothetical protein